LPQKEQSVMREDLAMGGSGLREDERVAGDPAWIRQRSGR
jgi:hypothetical protein